MIEASKQIRNGVKTKPRNLHRILETFVFYVGSEMNCVSSQGEKKENICQELFENRNSGAELISDGWDATLEEYCHEPVLLLDV